MLTDAGSAEEGSRCLMLNTKVRTHVLVGVVVAGAGATVRSHTLVA
jgi:hypothetical protein